VLPELISQWWRYFGYFWQRCSRPVFWIWFK